MKGSLIIVSFFIIGTLCGVYHLIPYDFTDSKLSYYALCGLMFCVGISIGNDPNTLKSFRSLNPRLVFLPIMTILGTLAGCAIAGAFMSQRSPLDCMAVGAGFGYYSLSSIFITEYKGPELGTIALLSNIMREIIALLCAPLLVKSSSYFCWWSHNDGYHSSYHYPIFGKGICNHFHLPWLCCRFQRSVPSHIPLLNIILTAINPKIEKYSTIVFAHVLQKCFIKRYFYIKKQIIS